MKLRFPIIFLALAFFLFPSCEGSLDDEKRASNEAEIERFLSSKKLQFTKQNGVYYATREKGVGYEITKGDSVAFWYIGYTLKGNYFDTNILEEAEKLGFDTSVRDYSPIKTVAGTNDFLEGINRGLILCREGEWGTILFPAIYGFGENIVESIPVWSPLAYDIFIIYVKNQEIEQEQNIISNFVASSSGYTQDSTSLWYKYITENESGISPSLGDTIYGWYKGSTMNNVVFEDLAAEGQELVLGDDELIDGLLYGFLMMKTGESMNMLVPSPLGFGITGTDIVAPYTPIFYELRLDSIK
ncbi:MAG: hypothetical protein CVT98_09190 [Bacteroidetes bacterium HGW-Bacteroidetes-15]|nr:MAG: hypothetical protein CVT98_09190 [Bacteroidetes bacterium HGW-Bacteroidetes-15]